MFDSIAALVNGLIASAQASLILALMILAVVIGGIYYMTGNEQAGKSWIKNGILGGAIGFGANSIVAAVVALVRH